MSNTVPPHTRQGLWPCHPLPGEGFQNPRADVGICPYAVDGF